MKLLMVGKVCRMFSYIERFVHRVLVIIVRTIFVLLTIASWLLAIIVLISGFPLYALAVAGFGVGCVILCRVRLDAGAIVFLCLCPIALPLAIMQEKERKEP